MRAQYVVKLYCSASVIVLDLFKFVEGIYSMIGSCLHMYGVDDNYM